MNWNYIKDINTLDELREISNQQSVLIFKHSTTCPISSTALNRLERNWNEEEMKSIKPYFLDLLAYREISNQIASRFGVTHQSPQAIVIKNGEVIYHDSHTGIRYDELKNLMAGSEKNA